MLLKDVARVFKGFKEREVISRIDGEESVEVAIFKEGGTNTVTVSGGVTTALGDLRERLKMIGVRPKSIWPHALVFHLNHPTEASRARAAVNRAYAKRPEVPAFAEQGIVKREPAR